MRWVLDLQFYLGLVSNLLTIEVGHFIEGNMHLADTVCHNSLDHVWWKGWLDARLHEEELFSVSGWAEEFRRKNDFGEKI